MVRSFDPHYRDFRTERGRIRTNYAIGEMMLVSLAESIEYYKPKPMSARDRPSRAAYDLIRAARKRARQEGKSAGQVLNEHRNALESYGDPVDLESYGSTGRFVEDAKDEAFDTANQAQSAEFNAEMDRQDRDRASRQPGTMLAVAGSRIDARGGLAPVFHDPTHEMAAERSAILAQRGTQLNRRPAARDTMGGVVPNADRLRALMPPQEFKSDTPLQLMHNPSGGGGFHNPVEF